MTKFGNALYVAGSFSKAGGFAASNIAKWDGSNWSDVGGGVGGQIWALAVSGSNLYVGGHFYTAGNTSATNVARWNGAGWDSLGAGVDVAFGTSAVVYALYANGTDLYAGGQFEMAGGQTAINVAHWDGSAWHPMDTGAYLPNDPESPFGVVQAITGDGTNIYIGGSFVQAGSSGATNLAKWNGTNWEAFGDCSGGTAIYTYEAELLYGSVTALAMHEGSLYAGGYFAAVGGVPAQGLARWDGTDWHNIGNVIGGPIKAFESYDGSLYLTGSFTSAGGVATTNAAILTGGNWTALNVNLHPFDATASLQHFRTQLYVGGAFSWLNDVSADNLAGWNGTNWSAVGLLPPADAPLMGNSLAVIGSNIFVGGYFTIPEAGASGLACWNGTAWNSPGGPLTNVFVSQLLAVGNILYVAGSLTDSSARQFGPVAAWDGTNWSNVPCNFSFDGACLATEQTNLYIAESLFTDNDYAVQVARWDGINLALIGDVFTNSRASALAASGTTLYLGLSQTEDNNSPALYSWSGNAWTAIGEPLADTGTVNAILPIRGNIYVGGSFSSLNGIPANSIARWNGTTWQSLASGIGSGNSIGATVQSMLGLG